MSDGNFNLFAKRPFRPALALSLLFHGAVIGLGTWFVFRHAPPTFTVQAGRGGDGIKPGEMVYFNTDRPTPANELNPPLDPLPVLMDVVTATPQDDSVPTEPPSAMMKSDDSSQASDLTITGWFGAAGAGTTTSTGEPRFHSRVAAPPPASPAAEKPGNGGLGGDGLLAGGDPTPSAQNKPPRYPPEARRRGIEGTVILQVDIREDGAVGSLSVADSSGYSLLDDAAVEAVRQWKFTPSIPGARMTPSQGRLPVRFVLNP